MNKKLPSRIQCLACPKTHFSKKGKATKYLGRCSTFINLPMPKKLEIIKQFHVCTICLQPVESCRQEEEGSQTCRLQGLFNLQCRSCNDYTHHTLLCSEDYQTYQTDHEVNFSQHSSFSCPSSPTSHWANSTENGSDDYADLGSCNTNQLHNQVQSQGQDNYLPDQQENNIHFFNVYQVGTTEKINKSEDDIVISNEKIRFLI